MRRIVVFVFIFCFSVGALFAQQINQKDANGKRQGLWQKLYPDSQQLRYQGSFVDDKEVGTFSFYCETCGINPFVSKNFLQIFQPKFGITVQKEICSVREL